MMTNVLTQSRPIRLKGRSFLALVLTPELPFEDWLVRLDDLAARSAGFFLRRPVVLDVATLDIDKAELRRLVDELGTRNVRIMGIEGARASLLDSALPPAMTDGRPAADFEAPAAAEPDADSQQEQAVAESDVVRHEGQAMKTVPSIVVTEPVRSGQSLFFPEGDVTIVGSVASGAEIVAGGSIHVYGTLRGRAMAGTMGYWIGAAFARQGYMREALQAMVHYAHHQMDLSRIEAGCLPENTPSRRLLEQCGFKYEGVAQSYLQIDGRWRNHVLYANLRADRRGKTDVG